MEICLSFTALFRRLSCSDLFIQETGGWKSDYVMKKVYRNVIDEEQKK
jgi:hypothetical protein